MHWYEKLVHNWGNRRADADSSLVSSGYCCFVDGSWDQFGEAGLGPIMLKNSTVVQWESRPVRTVNATQAEAQAILQVLRMSEC